MGVVRDVRRMIVTCAAGLVILTAGGGALMSLVESIAYREGLWLVFSVISTTGFGPGPSSLAGQLMAMGIFFLAVCCWFGIAVGAMESSMRRYQQDLLLDASLRLEGSRRDIHTRNMN